MPRITNQELINSLRVCADGHDCRGCFFAEAKTGDCVRKLADTAANRIEELLTKRRKQNAKTNGKKQHRRGVYR